MKHINVAIDGPSSSGKSTLARRAAAHFGLLYVDTGAIYRCVGLAAKKNGISVGVCGESASDPFVGVLWVAMGVDELSMPATYIPVISKLLSKLTRADLDEYAKTVENAGDDTTAEGIMDICREWMGSRIPDIANIVL